MPILKGVSGARWKVEKREIRDYEKSIYRWYVQRGQHKGQIERVWSRCELNQLFPHGKADLFRLALAIHPSRDLAHVIDGKDQ
jgi:hypothetical protein